MRRYRSVQVLEPGLRVSVEITVDADKACLGRDEVNRLTDHLTDVAMKALPDAPFIKTPMSKLKVTR